ncbi:MAG: GntR family transcriptional regulator [Thermoleophilaceae bacterium]|nr:GntR family transcriptional regulator [Thermoleophilaceae bacterium]
MTETGLAAVRRPSTVSTHMQVYAALRDAIVRAELAPGQKLSENELAGQLGVSRTPVREAIARLREDRLVEVVPQLGTFVARISTQAVADAQFIREALECAAIRRAAERCGEDDVNALEENLRAQERARDASDFDAFYVLDDAFHQTLCNLSGHPTVWSISQRAKGHLNRVRRLSLPIGDYLTSMVDEHRAVTAAVARHDADEAELALRYHLRMVLREVPRIRSQHPDFFDEA